MPLTASAISTWSYLIIQRSICPVEYSSSWGALLCLGSLVAKTNWSVVHWMFQSRNCNCLLYNALLAHSLGFHSTHSPVKYSQNQYQSDFAQYLPIKITSFSPPSSELPVLASEYRFKPIDTAMEWVEAYRPGHFHPVHIVDQFKHGRYKVFRNLGNGSLSTVWLVRDTE